MRRMLPLVSVLLVIVASCAHAEDFCKSIAFTDAFEKGWANAVDQLTLSPELIELNEKAVPCLKAIVESDGLDLEIPACQRTPERCQKWALRALGKIDTEASRDALLQYLATVDSVRLIIAAAMALGCDLQEERARPLLRHLLEYQDPYVRANAVHGLGCIGDRADYDALVEATMSLPKESFVIGARGLKALGDPRAVEPLKQYVARSKDYIPLSEYESIIKALMAAAARESDASLQEEKEPEER